MAVSIAPFRTILAFGRANVPVAANSGRRLGSISRHQASPLRTEATAQLNLNREYRLADERSMADFWFRSDPSGAGAVKEPVGAEQEIQLGSSALSIHQNQ